MDHFEQDNEIYTKTINTKPTLMHTFNFSTSKEMQENYNRGKEFLSHLVESTGNEYKFKIFDFITHKKVGTRLIQKGKWRNMNYYDEKNYFNVMYNLMRFDSLFPYIYDGYFNKKPFFGLRLYSKPSKLKYEDYDNYDEYRRSILREREFRIVEIMGLKTKKTEVKTGSSLNTMEDCLIPLAEILDFNKSKYKIPNELRYMLNYTKKDYKIYEKCLSSKIKKYLSKFEGDLKNKKMINIYKYYKGKDKYSEKLNKSELCNKLLTVFNDRNENGYEYEKGKKDYDWIFCDVNEDIEIFKKIYYI